MQSLGCTAQSLGAAPALAGRSLQHAQSARAPALRTPRLGLTVLARGGSKRKSGGKAGPRPPPRIPEKALSPEAKEAREKAASLAAFFETKLKACSLAFVGDNTELNAAVAEKMAAVVDYTPLRTDLVLEQLLGKPVAELMETDVDQMAVSECLALEQMSNFIRKCIATTGGGVGAAARADAWQALHGHIGVWLDDEPQLTEDEAPQRGAYSQAEIQVKLDPEAVASCSMEELVEMSIAQILPALKQMVDEDEHICGKKQLYIKFGCRGDWPVLMPPEWDPDAPPGENADKAPPAAAGGVVEATIN